MKNKPSDLLPDIPFLQGASDQTRKRLSLCERKSFEKGEIIYSPQRFFAGLCWIVSGAVSVFGKNGANDVLLNTVKEGGVFGAAAVFGGSGVYVSTVVAQKSTTVLFIPEKVLADILRTDGEAALSYVRFLSEKIRFLNGKITGFSASTAEEAVSYLLASSMPEEDKPFPVCVSRMASSLGLGRMSVYRVLHELEAEGILSFENGLVRILNKNALLEKTKKA